jgi:tetratricopeptide (TPR) repeat protein
VRKTALDDLENAVKVIDEQPIPFLLIAQLNLMPEGDTKRAAETLDQAEKTAKDNQEMVVEITVLKLSLEKDPVKREELLAQAVQKNFDPRLAILHAGSLHDLKKPEAAIEELKKVLDKDPDNVSVIAMLVALFSETKQHDEALKLIDALEKITDDDQLKGKLLFEKASLLAQMGKTEDAVKLLGELREKNPNDPLILIFRAGIHQRAKDYGNALKDIDAALRILPDHVPFKLLKAEMLIEKGDNADARKIVEELLKENENDLGLTLLFVQTLVNDKEYDKALETIEKVKSQHSEQLNSVRLDVMRVQILSQAKKSRQALDELNALFESDPENVEYLRIKGNLLLAVNRHTDAVKTFDAVLKAEPEDEMILNNLSWVLSTSPIDMLRNGKRALELAEKASELSEYKKAYILSTLAAAHAELGDFDKAVEWSQKCIDIAEKDPDDKERLNDLKKELESYKKKQPYREAMEEQ